MEVPVKHFAELARKGFFEECFINLKQAVKDCWSWGTSGNPARLLPMLEELLVFLHGYFQRHNIVYFLECGTLLGCVRHGQLIPWDYDLDVQVDPESFKKLITLSQTKEGIPNDSRFSIEFLEHERNVRIYLNYGNDWVWVDMLCWKITNQTLRVDVPSEYFNIDDRENYEPVFPVSCIFPLEKLSMYGLEFSVPKDPHSVLTILYGDYWSMSKIPVFYYLLYQPLKALSFISNYWTSKTHRQKIIKSI